MNRDDNLFDSEQKALPSEDDGSSNAAASAALSTLFNSEQGYDIELGSFPPPVPASGSATPAAAMADENGDRPHPLVSETLASASGDSPAISDLAHGQQDHGHEHGLAHRSKRPGTSRQHMLTRGGACEFCKRRKLKCTAEVPQCAACRRSNRECVYSQKKQRSRMKLLEDKVSELETKLAEGPRSDGSATPLAGNLQPAPSHPPPGVAHDGLFTAQHQQQIQQQDAPSSGVELAFLGIAEHSSLTLADMSLTPGGKHSEEPDLMTLADAATADTDGLMPWDSMEPQAIADEVVKAIIGHERGGVGEKICAHL